MNFLYGEDKYFIGAVKFFDVNNDFGFIASNNCNMPTPEYYQDFYVNSKSFIEDGAKKEGQVVVFQVEKQKNGQKRAANVRKISKFGKDVQLVLSYYGEHEYIKFKDNRKINLYRNIDKPLELVAEKVRKIIENDPNRSPQKTVEHFKFFIDHYKRGNISENRYIFDRQFSKEEKNIWDSLLSIFTSEERIEVLKTFPSIVKYFNDTAFVRHWLETRLEDNCSLSELEEIVETYSFIPPECVDYAKSQIEQFVDTPIKELLHKLSEQIYLSKEELEGLHKRHYWSMDDKYKEGNELLDKLHAYLLLTSNRYEEEKAECLAIVKKKRFKKELTDFVDETYGRDTFFTYLNNLSLEEFQSFKEELSSSISKLLNKAIEEKNYKQAVSYIKQLSVMGDDFLSPFKQRLLPLIKETLQASIIARINSPYGIGSDFFSIYNQYTSIYENSEKETIIHEFTPILKDTHSLPVLSDVSSKPHEWLSKEEALSLSEQIVSQWGYAEINEFIEREPYLFEQSVAFVDIIIKRTKEIIGGIPLDHFFDRTPIEEEKEKYYPRIPVEENCAFLKHLKMLIPEGEQSSEWNEYINSRSVDDLVLLFENSVITSLPENVVESIINTISLDEVYADKERWYYKPSLKNKTYANILETTEINLFPVIIHRLQALEMTDENVALSVLLTELMTANKPGSDSDYSTRQNWETNFANQIQNFQKNNIINERLAVILWAIHSKSTVSQGLLTEVFAFLPPYLQIKIVKKLFLYMSEGKIHHTAESLYKLVSNGKKPICFPLEITFTYLKLREKDPSKTLDNNIMLQLLEGREDTDEWIGIRSVLTPCTGRWIANILSDNRNNWKSSSYYNGIISEEQDNNLRIFIPQKMVDIYGNLKIYNNKYYKQAIQHIKISYKEDEYQVKNEQNGISYYFDKSHEIELFALARSFNFKYNGLYNDLEFEKNEEEQEVFCECRLSDKLDNYHSIAFYWCSNKPCFRPLVRYHIDNEWEQYTILDFMRILGISPVYINKKGKQTKFGHYIILSAYLKSFARFYEHLKCRDCGKLMKPLGISNFASRAVTEFACTNDSCKNKGSVVYLNHCFNKKQCNATIDSRDSKQCPNGQYICPECGACCSTENFSNRISNLRMTGGYISDRLIRFVENNMGHWEQSAFFCYKCGKPMTNNNDTYMCMDCDVSYDKH